MNYLTPKTASDTPVKGVTVGKFTYVQSSPVLLFPYAATLAVGSFCSIGDTLTIYLGGNHNLSCITAYPFLPGEGWNVPEDYFPYETTEGPVIIGNDVWIGNWVVIMSGVTIGDGAVIGAYSVVAKDIPPYSISVGNPSKVVRFKYPPEIIERLLKVKWWDWENEKIDRFIPLLKGHDIEEFLTAAEAEMEGGSL